MELLFISQICPPSRQITNGKKVTALAIRCTYIEIVLLWPTKDLQIWPQLLKFTIITSPSEQIRPTIAHSTRRRTCQPSDVVPRRKHLVIVRLQMRYLCQRLLHSLKSQTWLLVQVETRPWSLRSLLPHLSSQIEETWPVLSVQASCLRPCDRVREPQSSLATQEAKFQRHKASKNL